MPTRSEKIERTVLPLLVGSIGLTCWWAAVKLSRTNVFPSPLQVARGFVELGRRGVLLRYFRDSMIRVGVGYGVAAGAAVPLGILMGSLDRVGRALSPLFQVLRPISPLAWIPVAIVMFGVGNASPIFLIFLASLFPIVLATMGGVRDVPRIYLQAGRNMGLNQEQILRRVVLPAALPQIISGLRIALGVAWIVLVAAEMIAVDSGLGYLIIDARNAGKRYDLVVAGMLLIGVVGLGLDWLLRLAENIRSVRWGFRS